MLNLDTHIVLRSLAGTLTTALRRKMTADPAWSVSAIVLWEIGKLFQLGRISVGLDDPGIVGFVASVHVWPIDLDVCRQATRLDFRSDPADEIIAATSIFHRIPLVTRAPQVRRSKVVPLAGS